MKIVTDTHVEHPVVNTLWRPATMRLLLISVLLFAACQASRPNAAAQRPDTRATPEHPDVRATEPHTPPAATKAPPPPAPLDADPRLAELLSRYVSEPDEDPGVALIVHHRGALRFASAGLANRTLSTPITADTTFRLASVSKGFIGITIAALAEDGALSFDDPVTRHLPDFPYPDVTLRHLLNHTSGLPDYEDFEDDLLERTPNPTNTDLLRILIDLDLPLDSTPGHTFEYNNAAYDLLVNVAEAAAQRPFHTLLKARVLTPLGMHHSFALDPAHPPTARALGYDADGELDDDHPLNLIVGAGGVFPTARDMALWHRALIPDVLLAKTTLDAVLTPPAGSHDDYGFGFTIETEGDLTAISHSGSWVGFNTYFIAFPHVELSVVVLANTDLDVEALTEDTLELLIE